MMKRGRSELVEKAVGAYLRKRQYTENDTYKKSELTLLQNTHEMAVRGLVANESSLLNSIGFSSISGDATAIDQHFTKLKAFVSDAVEPFRTELTYVLFPMFVHLYLELICNGHKTPAQKFHHRHHGLFTDKEMYKTIVEDLKKIITPSDLSSFPTVKSFRDNRFTLRIGDDSLKYLLRYLKDHDHLILLQIFNFHIEVKDSLVNLHLHDDQPSEEISTSQPPVKSPAKVLSGTTAMKSLLQAIRRVQDGPPSLPSVCLYTLMNTASGVSSVALNEDLALLGAGFENSAIQLWSLVPTSLKSQPTDGALTHIRLACDMKPNTVESSPAESKVMRGHSGSVYGLKFTPDSKLLLSCSEDTTVRAWDMSSHENVAMYRGHNYPVWDLDFSSMGVYFATASQDRTAKLWMLDRTYPVRTFAGHTMDVNSVLFHPNCNYVATGSSDRTVRLWSVQDGKMVRMFQVHRGSVFALAFSPNGQLLASAGEDRRIKIWDLSSGSIFKELRGHTDTVYSLCFNRDSSILVSGGLDNHVITWDIQKGTDGNGSANSHTSPSPELLRSFATKSASVLEVRYTAHNLLVAVGTQPP